jgi:hypothetical protein
MAHNTPDLPRVWRLASAATDHERSGQSKILSPAFTVSPSRLSCCHDEDTARRILTVKIG